MDWKSKVRSESETQENFYDSWEHVYQEFKKRLDRDRKIYPPVHFDNKNFGTVVINSRKTPCEHIADKQDKGTSYYYTDYKYCPDCGVKL